MANNVKDLTIEEATALRDKLVAERRAAAQNIKILSGLPDQNQGVKMAIGQYSAKLNQIDDEIREVADRIKPQPYRISGYKTMNEAQLAEFIRLLVKYYEETPDGSTFTIHLAGE